MKQIPAPFLFRQTMLLILLCPVLCCAQPRYSPGVRAERETTWMRDSLHLPESKLKKIHSISLTYHRQMDSVNDAGGANKNRLKQRLTEQKDRDTRNLLSKEQYKKYYRREVALRKADQVIYKGRQPN